MIIAVDGPAGAGKSTVAKLLAKKLGFLYIDTGSMYRALTLAVLEKKIDTKDISALINIAATIKIKLINTQPGSLQVFLDGRDVTGLIRKPEITQYVSDIAKIKEIREIMVKLQRHLGSEQHAVLDGRDIGTVVFPDADRKFYIDAEFKERVKRRFKELKGLSPDVTIEDIGKDLKNRDTIDSTREHSPLRKAEDAIYIDTTDMTIEEVVNELLKIIQGPQATGHKPQGLR